MLALPLALPASLGLPLGQPSSSQLLGELPLPALLHELQRLVLRKLPAVDESDDSQRQASLESSLEDDPLCSGRTCPKAIDPFLSPKL